MTIVVREWFGARSAREQRLILIMAAIALPLLAWLLIVMPLSRAYERALTQHLEAVDRNGRIRALAGGPVVPPPRAPAGEVTLLVAESAAQAGLTLASNNPSGPDAVTIAIAQAAPTAVAQWLSGFEARGMRVEDLRMSSAGPGSVSVSARIVRIR
jgi:general secretion pathway protein M